MSLIDDLRVNIGDDGLSSGATASGISILTDLRIDYGDDAPGGISGPSGPSYTTCPTTTVDNTVARWDGTNSCAIQDSQVIIDDSGNITTPGGAIFGDEVCFQDSINLSQRIITAAGNVQMTDSDTILWMNKTVGESTTITLPLSPKLGRVVYIKDMKGDADINFITVVMSAGTIDGLPQFIMSNNYQSLTFAYNGSEWNII